MVADIFENFQPPSEKFLATPLQLDFIEEYSQNQKLQKHSLLFFT